MSVDFRRSAVVVEDVGVDVSWSANVQSLSLHSVWLTLESRQLGQDEGGQYGVGHHHGGGGGGLGQEEDEGWEEDEDGLEEMKISEWLVRWGLLTVSCMM